MLRNVLLKSLRDVRRGFAWWSLGLVGLVAMMVSVYPSVRDNPSLSKLVKDYPDALQAFISFGGAVDYASAAGYLGSELFSFMVPLLLLVAAIGGGAGTLAGEEERGTLDLLLALPVSRRRVAAEKLAAWCTEVAGLGFVFWLALWIGTRAAGMHVSANHLAAATLCAVLIAFVYGSIAFLLGAATGRRGTAIGVASALAVAAYLVNALSALVHALHDVRYASPFYHYSASDPLRHGLGPWHVLFLVAVWAVASVAAVVAFGRRDLRT